MHSYTDTAGTQWHRESSETPDKISEGLCSFLNVKINRPLTLCTNGVCGVVFTPVERVEGGSGKDQRFFSMARTCFPLFLQCPQAGQRPHGVLVKLCK